MPSCSLARRASSESASHALRLALVLLPRKTARYLSLLIGSPPVLDLFRPDKGPGHAERILALGIAVAPEHVLGLHVAGAAGIHRPLPPGIHVRNRQHQGESRRLFQAVA